MRNGEGFLLVYSIAERDTLYEATRFHEEILRVKDSDTPPPIILLGNKCDKEDERVISTSGVSTFTYRLLHSHAVCRGTDCGRAAERAVL
jgi:GTPase SAR1 family protein